MIIDVPILYKPHQDDKEQMINNNISDDHAWCPNIINHNISDDHNKTRKYLMTIDDSIL